MQTTVKRLWSKSSRAKGPKQTVGKNKPGLAAGQILFIGNMARTKPFP